MARIRTIKPGVGIISPHEVTKSRIAGDELRRGEGMVYRMLDTSGECVYIGFTSSPLNRLQAHLSGKPWADEVAAIYYSAGMTERRAREIETEDIRMDRPKYNRTVKRENSKHET